MTDRRLQPVTAPILQLLERDLFVPGFCNNSDDNEPILNIRLFEEKDGSAVHAFSSIETMRFFFDRSGFKTLRYMRIRSPSHYEAAIQLGRGLVIDSGAYSEIRISHAQLIKNTVEDCCRGRAQFGRHREEQAGGDFCP